MYKEIIIGEVKVPLMASASIVAPYKRLFKSHPLKDLADPNMDEAEKSDIAFRIAYLMNMRATGNRETLNAANMDQYEEWLDQFTYGDMVAAAPVVIEFFVQQTNPTVHAKN